jgi:hypothetical protein
MLLLPRPQSLLVTLLQSFKDTQEYFFNPPYYCHQKERDPNDNQTPPVPTALLGAWSSIQHTHTNRAFTANYTDPDYSEPLTDAIPPKKGFQDEFLNFRFTQKGLRQPKRPTSRTPDKNLRFLSTLTLSSTSL